MAITQGRLDEIGRFLQSGQVKLPQSGILPLPDSPNTGLSSTGKVIDISTGQELGSISPYGAPTVTGQRYSGIITGETLTPSATPNYVTPEPTTYSGVTIPTPLVNTLSKPQQEEGEFSKRIQSLNEILARKPAYETEQRKALGIEQRQATQTSLYNQLLNLKAQTENIPAQLQAASVARGRTEAGIAPLQTAQLRNAGIQANILNAQYSASTNDLANAERQLTQAVNDKFAPYEAERNAKLQNLQLIQSSPEYTTAEKARAAFASARLAEESTKRETAKATVSEILKLANIVAASPTQDAGNALVLRQLTALTEGDKGLNLNQSDVFKAIELAQRYLVKTPDVTATLGSLEEFRLVSGRVPKNLAELNDFTARRSAAARAPITPTVGTDYVPGTNPTVDNWARLIIAGQASITQVPNPRGSTLRSDVVNAISQSGQLLLSDKDREKLSILQNAENVVSTLKDLVQGVSPANAVTRLVGGPLNYLSAFFQINDKIASYAAARKGFVANVARTLGEKGALSEGDVSRAISNIPTLSDTRAVRNRKFQILEDIIMKSKTAIIKTSTEPLNQFGQTLKSPDGAQQVDVADLTSDQIEEAKNAGWK